MKREWWKHLQPIDKHVFDWTMNKLINSLKNIEKKA